MNYSKFNKTAFRVLSFKEAESQREYWLTKSPLERLSSAWELIMSAYNLNPTKEHRLDRTAFCIKKET
jgi:hypothetical protein